MIAARITAQITALDILGVVIPALDSIDWHRLLGRPPLPSPAPALLASIVREPILITGAGGSIGSALARKLARARGRLVLLESSENNLFELQSEFTSSGFAAEFYLGSAGDEALLQEIFARHRPRIVFHAAAFKHVPLLEEQLFAAITNNVVATRTLVAAAAEQNAHLILLSSDKAVAPASVMGATKLVAEQLVLTSGGTVLRLGNVLGSSGSVAETFARQIATAQSITVTDPAARRYFVTLGEAVDLLLAAAAEPSHSTLFIPDLRSATYIADLARFMTRWLAPTRDIPIGFTRLRAGEKEAEALFSPMETPHPPRASGLSPVDSPTLPPNHLHDLLEKLKNACQSRESATALSILQRLVPDYTPSRIVESTLSATEPPVHNV